MDKANEIKRAKGDRAKQLCHILLTISLLAASVITHACPHVGVRVARATPRGKVCLLLGSETLLDYTRHTTGDFNLAESITHYRLFWAARHVLWAGLRGNPGSNRQGGTFVDAEQVFQPPDKSSEGDVETKLSRLARKLDEAVGLFHELKKS